MLLSFVAFECRRNFIFCCYQLDQPETHFTLQNFNIEIEPIHLVSVVLCLGRWEVVLIDWVGNIVCQAGREGGMGGGEVARLVSLLPLLTTLLLELSRELLLLLLLLLLRATPLPAWVADAVLGGARVLRQVGAGEAGWTLAP